MLLTSLVPDVGTAFKSEVPMVTTPSDLATKNASPAVSAKSPESQITTDMMKTETNPVPDTRGCNMSHILSVGEEWDVVTPYYPSNYGNDLRCQWTVESLTGRVDVYFIDMRIEENYDAITMVAVDAGGDFVPVINNYSGNQSPGNFSVNHGKVMLFFLSDGASTERGFWVRFKAETNDAELIDDTPTPLTTDDCNKQISIQRGQVVQFESPNYPDLYSSDLLCLWAVHTTDGSHIVVRFSSFETESNYDFVDIGIGNGEEVEQSRLIRHSGSAIPGDLVIPSSNAWIRFYSDGYQELGGFQGNIEAIPPVANTTRPSLTTVQEECGSDLYLAIGQSVNITSPNFPGNYDDLLRCMWVFTTQDDCKLHISFKSFDTEALYDYVEIGEGSGPISGTIEIRHHGNNLPIDYISVTSQSWVSFTSDISMNLGGFQYTVTAIESIEDSSQSSLIVDATSQRQEQTSSCVQRFNLSAGDTMTLKTPNFPNQYDNALNCLWTFFVPDDVMISVVFDSFQTEAVYDYMEAGLGPGPGAGTTLTTQHSGNALPRPLSGSPSLWISFLSDGSIQSSGFEATISAFKVTTSQVSPAAVYPSTTPTSVHCTRNYNLTSGDVVYLTSPNFPNNYGNDLDCLWKFVATDGAQLQVHFISFSTQYGHDFLEAGEGFGRISGTPILERKSGPWLPLDFMTQGNTAWIDFHSDDSDSNEGFEITVTAVKQDITTTPAPPQVTTSAPTTAALGCRRTFHLQEGDTATVTTPNYPSPYDDLLDCLWVFIASDQSVLEVSFQTFSSELGYDYMEAGEGSGPTDGTTIIHRHSGAQLPDDFSAMSSSAWISFYSDVSMNDSGFEVKVTALQPQPDVTTRSTKRTTSGEPECLTVLSIPAENTVIVESPNYPSRYDNNLECTWIISTVEGYQLNVIFNTFDTEQEYDVLETGEGIEPDKRRFDQFSGSTLPDGFTTLSSSMWIVFRSDRSVNKSGFHLTVTSVQY
ncbi:CUB and sushi domain-containing protein 1-like isoform X2 [Ptychodera flava]|uniref:CUB and sushi domain-containing protein 1-like isoform X2 n=1 Tax=Ptychodera flava TaxID=63121 RepID=UPI00396A5E50